MNLFKSIGDGIRGGFRFFASSFLARGTFGGSIVRWMRGVDSRRKAGDIYDNGTVSAGIGWYWRNMLYPRIQVERQIVLDGQAKTLPVPGHSFVAAVEQGPFYDHSVLFHGTLISWLCAGWACWFKVRSQANLVIGYVYVPHFLIRPMADKDNPGGTELITYFEYQVPGGMPVQIAREDIVYLRHGIDPKNPMQGLSPLAGCLSAIGNLNEVNTLTGALLNNAGIPGIVLSPKTGEAKASPEQKQQLKSQWRENTTGESAGMPNVVPFPVDVTVLGFSPDDLALDKTKAAAVSEVCSNLGFDPMVLGLPSQSKTYSNYKEAIEAAYEGALLPMMMIWAIQIGHQTLGDFLDTKPGDKLGWDLSKVRALQDDEDKIQTRWRETWKANGCDRATFKEKIGLPVAAGDKGLYFQDTVAQKGALVPKGLLPAARRADDARSEIERS